MKCNISEHVEVTKKGGCFGMFNVSSTAQFLKASNVLLSFRVLYKGSSKQYAFNTLKVTVLSLSFVRWFYIYTKYKGWHQTIR